MPYLPDGAWPEHEAVPEAVGVLSGATVMQVCPVIEDDPEGRAVLAAAAALVDAGARSLVATTGGALVGDLQALGGLWIPLPANRTGPLSLWRNAGRLQALIQKESVDLLHARDNGTALSGLLAVRRTGSPFVTLGTTGPPGTGIWRFGRLSRFYSSIARHGDLVVVGSHLAADCLLDVWPESRGRVRVVPTGLDAAAASEAAISVDRVDALRRTWRLAPHERAVLLLDPAPRAAAFTLVEAMAALGLREEVVAVLCIPEGQADALQRRIVRRGLADRVRRVGACPDRAAALLVAAGLVVMSGGTGAERAALQAQALGCPVIVGDGSDAADAVLAPPEVTPDRRTGWRILPGDPAALADAVAEVLDMGFSHRDLLGRRARAHVECTHSREAMVDAMLTIYAELLSAPR